MNRIQHNNGVAYNDKQKKPRLEAWEYVRYAASGLEEGVKEREGII
jgi:hypothetical protein